MLESLEHTDKQLRKLQRPQLLLPLLSCLFTSFSIASGVSGADETVELGLPMTTFPCLRYGFFFQRIVGEGRKEKKRIMKRKTSRFFRVQSPLSNWLIDHLALCDGHGKVVRI
ncbi:hypothetical protein B0T13DRAFT_461853 [Neurospora crassa]|nr:hypothetical protein B0T13DRAFT_461853 [Neurospora crassa]